MHEPIVRSVKKRFAQRMGTANALRKKPAVDRGVVRCFEQTHRNQASSVEITGPKPVAIVALYFH